MPAGITAAGRDDGIDYTGGGAGERGEKTSAETEVPHAVVGRISNPSYQVDDEVYQHILPKLPILL